MFYSDKYKLLYIASPKSGSTSVEKSLFEIDEKGQNHTMTIRGEMYTGKDMHHGAMGHAQAWEIRDAIGAEVYESLHSIGFVRHPADKLISTYYFNKKLNLLGSFNYVGRKKLWQRRIKGFVSRLSTRILPFYLWIFIFPMKTSFEYFHDKNDKRIVKYLGRTDQLKDDLKIILKDIGIDVSDEIPHANKTSHKGREHYLKNSLIQFFIRKKFKKDFDLYKKSEKEINFLRKKSKN